MACSMLTGAWLAGDFQVPAVRRDDGVSAPNINQRANMAGPKSSFMFLTFLSFRVFC
jgi:hypothetical protein